MEVTLLEQVGHMVRLHKHQIWRFENLPEPGEVFGRRRAVHYPVIERQAQVHHRTNDDCAVFYNRLLLDRSDSEYRALAGRDDRVKAVNAVSAQVCDGKRAAGEVVGRWSARSGSCHKLLDLAEISVWI